MANEASTCCVDHIGLSVRDVDSRARENSFVVVLDGSSSRSGRTIRRSDSPLR